MVLGNLPFFSVKRQETQTEKTIQLESLLVWQIFTQSNAVLKACGWIDYILGLDFRFSKE
jgi:hypothetical protein